MTVKSWSNAALAGVLLALSSGASVAAEKRTAHYQPVTRDERVVTVDGKPELWRLQWSTPPEQDCPAGDIGWISCPCEGFEFGEAGRLELLRLVDDKVTDRLDLSALFFNEDNSYDWRARLARWPKVEGDIDESFRIDQLATEFILQTAALPCGKKQSIVVGVSKNQPRLHAFGTVEHPRQPLELYVRQWDELRKAKLPLELDMWSCGDHGSERQSTLTVSIDARGLHAFLDQFGCPNSPNNGQRLEHKIL